MIIEKINLKEKFKCTDKLLTDIIFSSFGGGLHIGDLNGKNVCGKIKRLYDFYIQQKIYYTLKSIHTKKQERCYKCSKNRLIVLAIK